MVTLADALEQAVRNHPNKTFLYFNKEEISFKELDERSNQMATAFLRMGLRQGDKIGIVALNQPEWLYTFFAAAKIGAVVVSLSPRYRASELEYMLNQSECKVLVCLEELNGFNYSAFFEEFKTSVPNVKHFVFIGNGFAGSHSFHQLLHTEADLEQLTLYSEQIKDNDPLIMIYTSGTTGQPKGTIISHRSMLSSARSEVQHLEITNEDSFVCSLPLNHVGGITCVVASALVSQATVILIPRFRPDLVLEAIDRVKPTIFPGVPTMYFMLLTYQEIDRYDLSSMRYCIAGGSNLDPELCKNIQARMPQAKIINLYGLSETSGACILSALHDDSTQISESLGVAIGDYQIKIVNQQKQEVPIGEIGELAIKGQCVAKGYYGMSNATEDVFASDGWFYTGDLASMDTSGRIYFKGRKKEMYINGGFNVYPMEIENVLTSHPKVAIAAGIGIPHEVYGEVGHYYIIPALGQLHSVEELREFCREHLADYKVPHSFEIVNELPLTPAGKVQKVLLKQQYLEKRK